METTGGGPELEPTGQPPEVGKEETLQLLDQPWFGRVEAVTKRFDLLDAVTPTNAKEQREQFLAGYIENPVFEYPGQDQSTIDEAKRALDLLEHDLAQEPNPLVLALYSARISEERIRLALIEAVGRDDRKFYQASVLLYGEPSPEALELAIQERRVFKGIEEGEEEEEAGPTEEKEAEKLAAADIQRVFQHALEEYGFRWPVLISDDVVAIRIKTKGQEGPRILIPTGREVSLAKVARLVRHEIETHVLRGENAKLMKLGLLRDTVGLDDYIPTEEGLATWGVQELRRERGWEQVPVGLVGTIGVGLAADKNFREVFEAMRGLEYSPKTAWKRTVRIFRGIRDTNNHEGHRFTRDWVYRKGNMIVCDFVHRSPADVDRLWVGKAGIHHLGVLWELGIREPKRKSLELKIEDLMGKE